MNPRCLIAALLFTALLSGAFAKCTSALDHISFERDDKTQHVSGRILTTSKDGGRLLQTSDGVLWAIQPDEIKEQTNDDAPFKPLNQDKAGKRLISELPDGFRIHTTARYVVCYDTSRAYAVWCGGLLERLHRAFVNYWTRRGLELHEPEFPLIAIVFSDADAFREVAQDELGNAAGSVLGYYSLRTNRVLMYDLTGSEAHRGDAKRRRSAADINRLLARPQAESQVATIVHEATHQIAYNSGLQRRFADNPAWLSEGLAIYFEAPDLSSGRGWRGIGQINHRRLTAFRAEMTSRPSGSLAGLLANDRRFKDTRSGPAAYAEAWALNYFLIRKRPEEFTKYLQLISAKPRLVWDKPDERLAEFRQIFGNDLAALDAEFLKYIEQLR